MNAGVMHKDIDGLMYATVKIMGNFAFHAPLLTFGFIERSVPDFRDEGFDFYEFETGHGYFFPRTQRSFSVKDSSQKSLVTLDADELGIALTLSVYDGILNADMTDLSEENKQTAMAQMVDIRLKRDYLIAWAMLNFNSGNLKLVI